MKEALFNYCCRLGDNALILSYRLSEYSSHGPFLEEDLAISNVALDLLGQSESLLKYAGQVEGEGRSEDDLAYRRPEREFKNCLLVEMPNTDFAYITVRQYFFDAYHWHFLNALAQSSDETLAAIAAKSLKEVAYHLQRSRDWVVRLGAGTEESISRMQEAVNNLWMYTGEMFEMDEVDSALIADGIAVDLNPIREQWTADISAVFERTKLSLPDSDYFASGGKQGVHTEHMGYILAQLQFLPTAYPDAVW